MFFSVLDGFCIEVFGGLGFVAGYQALKLYFDEMFLGCCSVLDSFAVAQTVANVVVDR
ncbi:MAG: hypothetical protein O7C59_08695 [Rickettsia endosymbiont of Ixodes persulcatus]|nr:hypothetical protein [Rickettsia endosymbiont of Ixodes persulcatus]